MCPIPVASCRCTRTGLDTTCNAPAGCRGRLPTRGMRGFFYRFTPAVSGLALFIGFSVLYVYGDTDFYRRVLTSYGVLPFDFPFLDMSAWLAVWECTRQGFDVISANPCDVLQRAYSASPLWISASAIPLGVRNTAVVGSILDLLFLSVLSLLPPPRCLLELLLVLAATLSTTVVFALERGNPDVMLFLLTVVTSFLARGRLSSRLLAYSVALVAGLLKYYPMMMFIILLREGIRVFVSVMLGAIVALAVFLAMYHAELGRGVTNIAHGPYNTGFFAAQNLPFLLGEVAGSAAGSSEWAPLVQQMVAGGLYAILIGWSFNTCRRLLHSGELRAALAALRGLDQMLLVIGSAVIAGCFFAGQSITYRGVYFLLVIPGLLAVARGFSRKVRNLAFGTCIVIVLLMWSECFRFALYDALGRSAVPETFAGFLEFLFWLVRELGWWWAVGVMLTVLVDFLWASPVKLWLESRLRGRVVSAS
jgi:hypothetical protein